MADPDDRERPHVGLCFDCGHGRRIESSRGSVFYLCEFSGIDARWPKYPQLPVISCAAFQPRE